MATKTWTAANGTWGNGLNWSPTGYAGASDDAYILSTASITGNGSTNSITVAASVTLSGIFATGTLAVGIPSTIGVMTLSGGNLLASSATILFGPLTITGSGTKLTVTGQLTLGGTRTSLQSYVSNTLVVSGGGVAQLGSVLMTATPNNGIVVTDGTSKVEIGSAGGAAVGTITVDAGKSVVGQGSLTAPNGIVNSGTITAQGGTLAISGAVSGSGQLQIGANATLYLETAASKQNVAFTGAGGQLEVVPTNGGLSEAGTISGFAPGDSILYAGSATVSSATYAATGTNLGTLTLNSALGVVGSLTLAGNYTGYVFQVTPNASYGAVISVVAPGSGSASGSASPGSDAFAWIGSSASWNAVANWRDTTTNTNSVAVPGAGNMVVLNGTTGVPLTITGPGVASVLTAVGNTLLSGSFLAGVLNVGTNTAAGGLSLATGAKLTTNVATVAYGSLQASGAATKLAVAGTLTLGGSRGSSASSLVADSLSLTNGAAAQVGMLAMPSSPGGNSVSTDSTSSLEVGTAGTAAAGSITVDSGQVLEGVGLVVAAGGVVNQGTIGAEGGMLQIGSGITGGGQLAIGTNATLSIYNGTSTQPVSFAGANGTLEVTLTASGALTETGTVTGFTPGDTILVASSTPVTTVSYTAGANGTGTLALIDGAATIGTIGMTGDFSHEWFEVAPNGTYGTAITVVPQYPSPDPLFDSAWYLKQYPSVAASGVDPYQDYMTVGWKAGRNPNAWFNTNYYLNQNPDIAAGGLNPLTHFEQNGWKEGRDPSVLFSDSAYLKANADVAAAGINPLLHYVEYGQKEGRAISAATPHAVGTADPLVDYTYYYAQHPDIAAQGIDASVSYNTAGWKLGYNPNPYFDTNYYLQEYPDVKAAGMDPLTHYEQYGYHEGRVPSLAFNGASYLAANTDVAAAGMDPLVHYMDYGVYEGRMGFLTGQGTAPDPLVNTVYYDTQLGASLFPTGAGGQSEAASSYNTYGWEHGLNPDAFFDTSYYLSHNLDVAASGMNPLLHYEEYGWHEGRNPSAQFSTNAYLNAYADVKAAGMDPLLHYIEYGMSEGRTAFHV